MSRSHARAVRPAFTVAAFTTPAANFVFDIFLRLLRFFAANRNNSLQERLVCGVADSWSSDRDLRTGSSFFSREKAQKAQKNSLLPNRRLHVVSIERWQTSVRWKARLACPHVLSSLTPA